MALNISYIFCGEIVKKLLKKSLFNIIILLAVLAAAAFFYFKSYLPGLPGKETAGRTVLFAGFVREDISGLTISFSEGRTNNLTSLEFTGGSWFLNSPLHGRADGELVRDLLNDLPGIVAESVLTDKEGSRLHEYGLDRPSLKLTVILSDSNSIVLTAGFGTPVGGMRYVMLNDKPGLVYLVYDYKLKNFKRAGAGLMDRGKHQDDK